MTTAFLTALRSVTAVAATVLALQAGLLVSPVQAQYSSSQSSVERQDAAIKRAYRDVLKREPNSTELRRYRAKMTDDGWTEDEIRRDLRERRNSGGSSGYGSTDPDKVIRRAYQDILHREPDAEGLRHYRIEMLDNGWTEQQVRDALRKSGEHDTVKADSADSVIRRAYQDLLGRDPDAQGLARYRNEMLKNGWTERQVRDALRNSPEYREKNTMTRAKAEAIVNRAYRNVLGRDADPAGMEGYVQGVLRQKWTQADVERELRKSDEYRNKR